MHDFDIFNISSFDDGNQIVNEDTVDETLLYESVIYNSLTADELNALCENTTELNILKGEGLLSEKTQVIKINKEGQLKRLEGQAILVLARKAKDKDFIKLIKVWKMRRLLLDRLRKKHGAKAKVEAQKMYKALSRSKSTTAKKAASKSK